GITNKVVDASRGLEQQDERLLAELGIGITNLVDRPTARADEIASEELRAGASRLVQRVILFKPRAVAVVGITAVRLGSSWSGTGWHDRYWSFHRVNVTRISAGPVGGALVKTCPFTGWSAGTIRPTSGDLIRRLSTVNHGVTTHSAVSMCLNTRTGTGLLNGRLSMSITLERPNDRYVYCRAYPSLCRGCSHSRPKPRLHDPNRRYRCGCGYQRFSDHCCWDQPCPGLDSAANRG